VNTTNEKSTVSALSALNLNPKLLNVLTANKWLLPTPIQAQAIPLLMQGKDILGIAQTGTGKTLAFGIPMVNSLSESALAKANANAEGKGKGKAKADVNAEGNGNALILVPTRELARQVADVLQIICRPFHLNACLLIGGASIKTQQQNLSKGPHIVIATPGRLLDHLQQRSISLGNVKYLVLDEADRMLDMGFKPQIEKILSSVPAERQTMLFSATMPQEIRQITREYMRSPATVEVAPAGTPAEAVEHSMYIVRKDQKKSVLARLIDESFGPVLVFVRTKHLAAHLTKSLFKTCPVAELHSNRSQNQRQNAIDGFRSGKYRVLIATDIAARGIDIKDIELVINYDLPDEAESYIHRIGRTGRAGNNGQAISIAAPDQCKLVRDIERLLKKSIRVVTVPGVESVAFEAAAKPGTSAEAENRQRSRPKRCGRRNAGFRMRA
jgi:ATP-dependent RNA helicase RhlE